MAKRVLMAAATALALGVFGVSAASAARPLTVCESGPPTCDYKSIQEAINAAKTGDTIKIAAGTYHEELEVPGGGTATRLTLQGAGASQTTIESGTRPGALVTLSSGVSATITGVTITRGGVGATCCSSPGGIVNRGTLTLNDSTVSGNFAGHEDGGGIRNEGGTVTLNDSTVSGNHAGCGGECRGGGILNDTGGTMTLNDSTVSGNTADTGRGGGISNSRGTMTLNDSAVSGNTAKTRGGGISNEGGTVTLNRTTVSENKAGGEGFGGKGGGIFNAGTLTGKKDVITANTAPEGAGIFNEPPGEVELTKSKVQP
jgi:hypothetical protein